jgi:hypothetical protein
LKKLGDHVIGAQEGRSIGARETEGKKHILVGPLREGPIYRRAKQRIVPNTPAWQDLEYIRWR